MKKIVLLDKAAGVVVASAAGDALGAGYEFGPKVKPQEVSMIGGGLGGFAVGEWTDDTSMGLAILKVAADGIPLESEEGQNQVGENFLKWFYSNPPDIGIQTSLILNQAAAGGASKLKAFAKDHFDATGHAAGNGSLMRTGGVALSALGNDSLIVKRARLMSDLTHGDPLAAEACIIWSIAIDRAVRQDRLDGVYDGVSLLPSASQSFWRRKIEEVKELSLESFTPNGYVVTALQAALGAVWSQPQTAPQDLEKSLKIAVSIGNDTDTVACIAGMLLGGRWGASAVPLAWRSLLHGYPGLKTADLVKLGVLSLGLESDASGWPLASSIKEHYRQAWPTTAFTRTFQEVPGFTVGNFEGLLGQDSKADVTISLCRLGAEERRQENHHEVWLADSGDLETNPNLDFIIKDTSEFIVSQLQEGKSVYLHCVFGASRTPIIAAKVLSLLRGEDPLETLDEIIAILPSADIKEGLIQALVRS